MTREIEYRGKFASFNQFVPHPDEGNWVYGDFVHDGMLYLGEYHDCIYTDGENGRSMIRVDPDTVGQYTGLKDKNGVKVFEGDVVWRKDSAYGYVDTGVVKYDCHLGAFVLEYESYGRTYQGTFKDGFSYNDGKCTIEGTYSYEVIGNIYDNLELLNKK